MMLLLLMGVGEFSNVVQLLYVNCHQEYLVANIQFAIISQTTRGSVLSESRKAKQAGIKVHWDKEADGDRIASLSRRVYNYVNHVLPFDIQHNGQEDLMSIQYFGRGRDDDKPDRYMPHCDGDCNGLDFKPGNRMVSVFICGISNDVLLITIKVRDAHFICLPYLARPRWLCIVIFLRLEDLLTSGIQAFMSNLPNMLLLSFHTSIR